MPPPQGFPINGEAVPASLRPRLAPAAPRALRAGSIERALRDASFAGFTCGPFRAPLSVPFARFRTVRGFKHGGDEILGRAPAGGLQGGSDDRFRPFRDGLEITRTDKVAGIHVQEELGLRTLARIRIRFAAVVVDE